MYMTGDDDPKRAKETSGKAWRRVLEKIPNEYAIGKGQDGREWLHFGRAKVTMEPSIGRNFGAKAVRDTMGAPMSAIFECLQRIAGRAEQRVSAVHVLETTQRTAPRSFSRVGPDRRGLRGLIDPAMHSAGEPGIVHALRPLLALAAVCEEVANNFAERLTAG